RAEAVHLAAAFAQETRVAGGFPDVLTKQILQLRFADAVDQRRRSPDELTLELEEPAQQTGGILDGGHSAGAGAAWGGRSGGDHGRSVQQMRPRLPAVLCPGGFGPTHRSSIGSLAR